MGRLPEPEDVDIIVSGTDSTADSLRATIEFIKAYKSREGYAEESKEARAILDALGIHPKDYRMDDPEQLLDHWRRCVADLTEVERNGKREGELK